MRFGLTVFSAAMAAVILSGCTTISESDYKSGRVFLAENPGAKREIIKDCISERKRESIGDQKTMAAWMNVSLARYPQAFCTRLWNSFASGRLTYAEYKNLSNSNADNSELIAILQGR